MLASTEAGAGTTRGACADGGRGPLAGRPWLSATEADAWDACFADRAFLLLSCSSMLPFETLSCQPGRGMGAEDRFWLCCAFARTGEVDGERPRSAYR